MYPCAALSGCLPPDLQEDMGSRQRRHWLHTTGGPHSHPPSLKAGCWSYISTHLPMGAENSLRRGLVGGAKPKEAVRKVVEGREVLVGPEAIPSLF